MEDLSAIFSSHLFEFGECAAKGKSPCFIYTLIYIFYFHVHVFKVRTSYTLHAACFYLGPGYFSHNSEDRVGSERTRKSGTDGSEGISFPVLEHSQTMSWKWGYFKGTSLKAARGLISLKPDRPPAGESGVSLLLHHHCLSKQSPGVRPGCLSIAVVTFSLTDKHWAFSRTVGTDAVIEGDRVRGRKVN